MDRFGEHWHAHGEQIASAWREEVTDDDLVMVPGDISWAMTVAQLKFKIVKISIETNFKLSLHLISPPASVRI